MDNMISKVKATIVALERYDVHGQGAVRLLWRAGNGASGPVKEARLAPESVYGDPAVGDCIEVELLMGEAVEVRRVHE
jgi:hypothetical protein